MNQTLRWTSRRSFSHLGDARVNQAASQEEDTTPNALPRPWARRPFRRSARRLASMAEVSSPVPRSASCLNLGARFIWLIDLAAHGACLLGLARQRQMELGINCCLSRPAVRGQRTAPGTAKPIPRIFRSRQSIDQAVVITGHTIAPRAGIAANLTVMRISKAAAPVVGAARLHEIGAERKEGRRPTSAAGLGAFDHVGRIVTRDLR